MHSIPSLLRVACCAVLATLPAWPGGTTARAPQATQVWMAVDDGRLAALRGGFLAGDGVMVSFGITRTVHIDGQLVADLHIPPTDLRSITPEQAQVLASELSQARVVQSGGGNFIAPSAADGTPGLIVQNTLDDRHIRSVTQIDAASNGMGILKQMNLSETLQRALAAAVPK